MKRLGNKPIYKIIYKHIYYKQNDIYESLIKQEKKYHIENTVLLVAVITATFYAFMTITPALVKEGFFIEIGG
ncbi:MAG TPA: hypothetical protein VIY08_05440 [Candidatus Nitrosocosmicus sp.]